MKFRRISLILMLVLSLAFAGSLSSVSADTTPPDLNSVSFSAKTVSNGETFSLIIDANDSSGITYVNADLFFIKADGSTMYYDFVSLEYNSSVDSFVTSLTVGDYWHPQMFVSYIYMEDSSGNYGSYNNGSDFTSPILEIIGTTPDSTTPVLNSIQFSTTQATVGDIIDIDLNVTDNESGVEYVSFDLHRYNSSSGTTEYVNYYGTTFNSTSGTWHTQLEFNNFWENGTYFIYMVNAEDVAGNYKNFYNGSDYTSPIFEGSNPDPITVSSVYFSTTTATNPDDVFVFVEFSSSLPNNSYVDLEIASYDDASGYWNYVDYTYTEYNSTSGLYQGIIENIWYADGNYSIPYIYVGGNSYYTSFINGTDYNSGELTVLGNGDGDTESPQLNDITASSSVESYGSFNITLNITDDFAGVQNVYVEVWFMDTTGDSYYYSWYSAEHISNSIWSIQVSIGSFENGTEFYINYVEYSDNANNYVQDVNGGTFTSPITTVIDDSSSNTGYGSTLSSSDGSYSSNPGETFYLTFSVEANISDSDNVNISLYIEGNGDGYMYNSTIDVIYSGTTIYEFEVILDIEDEYFITAYLFGSQGETSSSLSWSVYVDDTTTDNEFIPSLDLGSGGVSDTDQQFLVSFDVYSNTSTTQMVDILLLVTGPENFTAYEALGVTIPAYATFSDSFDLQLNITGFYDFSLVVTLGNNTYEDNYYGWEVNETGDSSESISVSITPNNDQSVVGETVTFTITLTSTFVHDMSNVTLVLTAFLNGNSVENQTFVLSLPANSSITQTIDITFQSEGLYSLEAVLYDDIDTRWYADGEWEVVRDDSSNDTTTTTTDTDGNSTDDDSNTTDAGVEAPQIDLPGFELYVSILSISTVLIGTRLRRLKN